MHMFSKINKNHCSKIFLGSKVSAVSKQVLSSEFFCGILWRCFPACCIKYPHHKTDNRRKLWKKNKSWVINYESGSNNVQKKTWWIDETLWCWNQRDLALEPNFGKTLWILISWLLRNSRSAWRTLVKFSLT